MTTFYVKNNSDKTVNFTASVLKLSSMGQFEMTVPFTAAPRDSVLVRKVGLRKDALPTDWFIKFVIFPTEGITFNDPNTPANWIKSTDIQGKPVYTFTMVK